MAATDGIIQQKNVTAKALGEAIETSEPLVCKASQMEKASIKGFPLLSQLKMMSCMICTLSTRLSVGMKISWEIMKSPKITQIVIGFMIWACFTFVKLGYFSTWWIIFSDLRLWRLCFRFW